MFGLGTHDVDVRVLADERLVAHRPQQRAIVHEPKLQVSVWCVSSRALERHCVSGARLGLPTNDSLRTAPSSACAVVHEPKLQVPRWTLGVGRWAVGVAPARRTRCIHVCMHVRVWSAREEACAVHAYNMCTVGQARASAFTFGDAVSKTHATHSHQTTKFGAACSTHVASVRRQPAVRSARTRTSRRGAPPRA